MIKDCPDPQEVSEFHFLQLRTLKLVKGNEKVSEKCANVVASSSKFGLLFVGVDGGFKVLKLDDILTVDEDKDNRSIEENYNSSFVQCQRPLLLAVSASQNILAVCSDAAQPCISFYNVCAFFTEGVNWQPFVSVPSKSNSAVCDFVWNPANEECYAYCLSDGSLCVEEVSGNNVKVVASLKGNATSVCWSPKGKQLVAGQKNGMFCQYKPNLSKVKDVSPPCLEESPISVSSICWISNTSYAVVYVVGGSPYLFFVTSQKDSPTTYTNFYDVCLGNNSEPDQKYFLHLEPSWGILICASLDSIEIAVLGGMPEWVQWDLREDGKALLPGKDGATHTIGYTVMYSAQKNLVISESESYPPMPIIFFLTNNGLLVSYHMINSKADAVSLVAPAQAPESVKAVEATSSTTEEERMVLKRSSSQIPASAPSCIGNSVVSMMPQPQSSFTVFQPPVSQPVLQHSSKVQPPISTPFSAIKTNKDVPSQASEKRSSLSIGNQVPAPTLSRPWVKETDTQISITSPQSGEVQMSGVQSSSNSYISAILSEIQSFNKELNDLKQLQSNAPGLDNMEAMATLKVFALNLQNFQKDISETMQSLSTDIFTLKNSLLESFVMVEEAVSRDRRRNDHSYMNMLKERALDPVTAKRMQKMGNYYHYLNTQLQEVNDKLDHDRVHFLSNKSVARENTDISPTEIIYKTIVNNQKVIHILRKRLNSLSKKVEEKQLRGIMKSNTVGRYQKRSTQEDLAALADQFLKVNVISEEEKETSSSKKLSSETQDFLKEFLKNSNVITVRPTDVYSPSQSRLLSSTLKPRNLISNSPREDESLKNVSKPTNLRQGITLSSPASKITDHGSSFGLPANINKESQNVLYAPVCEPVTPPETSSPLHGTISTVIDESPVSSNKNTAVPSFRSGITAFSTPCIFDSTAKDLKSTAPALNPLIGSKPLFESTPSTSVFSGQNVRKQISSETQASQVVVPKVLSFTQAVPKSSESASQSTNNTQSAPLILSIKASDSLSLSEPKQPVFVKPGLPIEPKPSIPVSATTLPSAFQQATTTTKSLFPGFSFVSNTVNTQVAKESITATPFTQFSVPNKTISTSDGSNNSSGLFSLKPAVGETLNADVSQTSIPSATVATTEAKSVSIITSSTASVINVASSATQVTSNQMAEFFSGSETKTCGLNSVLSQTSIPSKSNGTEVISIQSAVNNSILKQPVFPLSTEQSPSVILPSSTSGVNVPVSNTPQSPSIILVSAIPANGIAAVSSSIESPSAATVVSSQPVSHTVSDQSSSVILVSSAQTNSIPTSSTTQSPSAILVSSTPSTTVCMSSIQTPSQPETLVSSTLPNTVPVSNSSLSPSVIVVSSVPVDSVPVTSTPQTGAFSSEITLPTTIVSSLVSAVTSPVAVVATTTPVLHLGDVTPPVAVTSETATKSQDAITASVSASPATVTSSTSLASQLDAPSSTVTTGSFFFTQTTSTAATAPTLFGQSSTVSSSSSSDNPISKGVSTLSFESKPALVFGQATTEAPSFLGKPAATKEAPVFGQPAVTQSAFGQTVPNTGFGQASGGFFAQPSFGSSPATNVSDPNSQSTFPFGKPTFGQNSGTFGLAKSLFGQATTTSSVPSTSPASSFSFNQQSLGSENLFGQGSFFSGLGGKPSEENANKNVFGFNNSSVKPNNSLFGNSGPSSFGAKSGTFGGGSFSSGAGSVAQSGFGSFQQTTPQKAAGGFGSPPVFGGNPSFGSPPTFGSAPTFGSGNALSSVFGSSQQQPQANFSSFASASSPTFGSLASQASGFGSPPPSGFGSPQFGSSSPFGRTFGGGQPSGFGSPGSPPSNSSAFTQWRN